MSEPKNTYRTLKELSMGSYKEKGSKFIGYAVPCFSESEAKQFLESWRKEHYQARHVCYAYRFGVEKLIFRANDDGEPNNSAGAPILGQIQSFDLSNVLIGVVRYFGGTKLGVGGLIQAYREAAKEAITSGEIVEFEVFEWAKIEFNYSIMPQVMGLIKKYQLTTTDSNFELSCSLVVALPLSLKESIKEEIVKLIGINPVILGIY